MNTDKASLEKLLDSHVKRNFGAEFVFRSQQKEAVLDIIDAFFDSTCNLYLLDAPTGSGKSLIAMIAASFLTDFKMRG